MDKANLFSVIVPVYNEQATLRRALERLLKARLPLELEVIVVDDGSTDAGLESISDLVAESGVKVISNGRNLGKGAAIRNGLSSATGDLVAILDADLEYDPSDFAPLIETILEGRATVAYGTRTFGPHTAFSFWYVVGNKMVSLWASFLFNTWLNDIMTCLKVAPLETWRSLGLSCNGFDIEPEVTGKFLKAGCRIAEVPIQYAARTREEGKKLHWMDGVRTVWVLLRVRLSGR